MRYNNIFRDSSELWCMLEEALIEHPLTQWSSTSGIYTSVDILNMIAEISKTLMKCCNSKTKCVILCKAQMNTAIAILGCWKAGLIVVPVACGYGKIHYDKIISAVSPDVLIVDDEELSNGYNIPSYNIQSGIMSGSAIPDCKDLELNDVCAIMYTSGTTGTPKGVMLTECGLKENVIAIAKYFSFTDKDTILIARPLYHSAVLTGELLVAMHHGANIVFFDGGYEPHQLAERIGSGITVIGGTPTLLQHIAQIITRRNIKTELKYISISGECLSKKVAHNIHAAFPTANFFHVYGLTEASPRVAYLPPELFINCPESVGIPICDVKIKIVKEDGNVAPRLTEGRLFVTGPSIMKGYYMDSQSTERILNSGWLDTGDIAYMNERNMLFIKGRADDMIIKAGMNIYPREIEDALMENNMFRAVLVYKIISSDGQRIGLKVILRNQVSIREIASYCKDVLPRYALPDEIEIVDSFETGPSGKTVRRSIRKC